MGNLVDSMPDHSQKVNTLPTFVYSFQGEDLTVSSFETIGPNSRCANFFFNISNPIRMDLVMSNRSPQQEIEDIERVTRKIENKKRYGFNSSISLL
jgi:hypothetical protein